MGISKFIGRRPFNNRLTAFRMIEDLLYRIESNADLATVEAAIACLPVKYGLVVDLHYGWELSRQEIAAMLGWSASQVSRRLTRGISLLKYQLHPEALTKATNLPSY